MRQVFLCRPWVHIKEPPELQAIFERFGKPARFEKGSTMEHGGSDGDVFFIRSGLVFFSFLDLEDRDRVFAIVPPGGVCGDLDAVTELELNVTATFRRDTEGLILKGSVYREQLESDISLMKRYAVTAIQKEETHMEGMCASFTLPVEDRLIALFSSVIKRETPVNLEDWNAVPLSLTTFEIADVIASSRSTISTLLSKWTAEGLARRNGRALELHGKLFHYEYDWRQPFKR